MANYAKETRLAGVIPPDHGVESLLEVKVGVLEAAEFFDLNLAEVHGSMVMTRGC